MALEPVKIILRGKEHEMRPGMVLSHALEKLNINPESVLATRDGELIPEDEILNPGDVIKLVAVISGGSSFICMAGATHFEVHAVTNQPSHLSSL